MKRFLILGLILIIAFIGCSKRDNPVEPTITPGGVNTGFILSSSLQNTIIDEVEGRYIYIYEPPEYVINNVDSFELYIEDTQYWGEDSVHIDTTHIVYYVTDKDFPTLYLLHGFAGYYNYFVDIYMLEDILNEMISAGEIIPMVVITPDASNRYGGSFYTNSPHVYRTAQSVITHIDTTVTPPETTYVGEVGDSVSFGGAFEDFMVDDLIAYMTTNFNIDTVAAKRGISGHSMGGYGAMKLAMKHPDLFGSVSSMSAPLYFAGFEGLLPALFAENNFTPNDTAAFYGMRPASTKRITSMMFAMGTAFSPFNNFFKPLVDSLMFVDGPDTSYIVSGDTAYFHRTKDTTAFYGVDLPFDISGQLATESDVWDKWLANDPYTMLTGQHFDPGFANTPIYLDCGDQDDLGLNLHNQAFAQALGQGGFDYVYYEYPGYGGDEAGHSNFVADRLREVLKFHSAIFAQAMQSQ
jgi:S-formylglutathione hydrolase FrmB